ncbi:MAG: DUF1080 domain-containing protein [Planctomycetes bacterium]|nr:DUF1080 domain-containing protein [Planctomycetota bacterium]
MRPDPRACIVVALAACNSSSSTEALAVADAGRVAPELAAPRELVFERLQLSSEFTCEGGTLGDLDKDGHVDVIAGPFWYSGPTFDTRHELYPPEIADPAHYSDHFFDWTRDLDRDGWLDIVVVSFPGKAAYWLRNPFGRKLDREQHWERSEIAKSVDNESPAFVDLVGDAAPELVFMSGGKFVWAEPVANDPRAPWTLHPLSENYKLGPFVHGLGVGDVNGDGRADVLWKDGWFEQPPRLAGDPLWTHHAFKFTEQYGGAQMFVYDVDGDGDGDVITSLAAHHFGLSWFEQVRQNGALEFVEHRIMEDEPAENPQGICCPELHALDLADIDGDGLEDIVTGKRWWSHGAHGDPQPNTRPCVYWFELVRRAGKAEFVAHLADDQTGVGTQVVAGDVNRDGRADIVIGNKRGAFVLLQRRVTEAEKRALQAREPTLDFEDGSVRGWTADGDAFALQPVRGDTVKARGREPSLHAGQFWIGGYEKLGDGPTGSLVSNAFSVREPFASLLVGGGGSSRTRVELRRADTDKLLFKTAAADFESLQRVVVDLRAHVGQQIRIHLIDEEPGGWGHLNFDDFRFHAERPSFELPAGVPQATPYDEVENAGLPAPDAARAMSVPPGFQVDVIAAEPDVHQPIALAIDDRGRLWVAEAFTYPVRAPGDKGADDIVVFEDRDHDGSFETRTVFARELNLVSGLEVGFGGVWVGAAPYLMFIPDRNGDLVPDGPPEILLDGWAYQDTHETLNAFTWGPDGWLYGCHGVFTHSKVGKPGAPDSERTPLNAAVWRFHPTRHEFEVFAEGTSNPWGVDFDENGQMFITACVIPHLFHLIQGGRFERQAGAHFNKYVFDDIKTIADHRHYIGDTPHGGNNRSNAAGGGHAHCGLLIYDGAQWPEQYRGGLYFDNIHGNRINHDVVVRAGSGFVGQHAEDLLVANDRWFRGISFKQGPDGSVYFIDWYDKQACHWTEPGIWDRTNGRIYRLRHGAADPRATWERDWTDPDLWIAAAASGTDAGLAKRARRRVQEGGADLFALASLGDDALGSNDPRVALRALWALHAAEAFDEEQARASLASAHEYVRAWAIQLALEDRQVEPETLTALEQLAANDPSPVVRLYLASALQRIPLEQRWGIAERLSQHAEDAHDHNLPLMIWYGIEPLIAADPARALELFSASPIELLAHYSVRRAAAEPLLHAALVRHLAASLSQPSLEWKLDETAKALKDQRGLSMPAGWLELRLALLAAVDSSAPQANLQRLTRELGLAFGDTEALPALRATLADKSADSALRLKALDDLVRAKDAELAPLLRLLLVERALRAAAIRALASFDDAQAARIVLAVYPDLSGDEKRDALNTLSSRASFASALLDAIEDQRVPRTDLGAFVARKIESLGDDALTSRLNSIWGRVRVTAEDKLARIADLKVELSDALLAQADRARGREVFSRTCQQCHTLFGTGGNVGPELTGSNRADLDYLLSNMVDPNAVVGQDYLATMVWTDDGRIVTGILRGETDSSITLQTENERIVIAKGEIETRKLSDLSTMPEGLTDGLKPDELRDLVAYLRGPTQSGLLATAQNAGRFFDGASLAGWSGDARCWSVEAGEIVGRTPGLAHNEFLISDLELVDFRLRFEVKLVDDVGNSGVQFRSEPLEGGEVRGPQADIGPQWWGKLYEEQGRGLLWGQPGDAHVKRGDWNAYEIEARGSKIVTRINGQACVELDDAQCARRGRTALQLHSGGKTEVRFRNFVLEVLE